MTKVLLKVAAMIRSSRHIEDSAGYILMEDGTIVDVGQGEYQGDTKGIDVISRPKAVAMPGFVNSHGHGAMTLLRGAGDDLPLMDWLHNRIFPMEAKLTSDSIYWGTLLAAWEMIRSGTTCFTDMYMFMHDAAKAVDESGLRAVLSWGIVGLDEASKEKGIQNSKSFVQRWHGAANGRITTTLGPHATYTCPPEYLRTIVSLSDELNVPIQIHLCETRIEVEDSLKQFSLSPIAHSEACGLFNRPVLAAHCVHVTDADIEILKQYDVKVAHNPQSNLKLSSGVAPVVKMKQAGLTVGIGTDGASSNNNLDMFEELRLAATLHKGITFDSTAIPAPEAFQMATEDSAKCVFLDSNHGTITVGAAADITLLDLGSPHFTPAYDLLSNVVYAAGADDVTDVFVAGRQLMSNREVLSLDTERIRFEVKKIQDVLNMAASQLS